MKNQQESDREPLSLSEPASSTGWSQALADMLASQLRLLKAPYDMGCEIIEESLRQRTCAKEGHRGPVCDEFRVIKALPRKRGKRGLSLPAMIYRSPYRDRVDWASFPPWARPVDPEMFQECGHEG